MIITGFLALTSVAANAHQRLEYYIKAHNHYGEAVYFSCEDRTPREIHNGRSRTVNIHGYDNADIDCEATHDGDVAWNTTVHMDHHHRRARVVINDQSEHDDDESQSHDQ